MVSLAGCGARDKAGVDVPGKNPETNLSIDENADGNTGELTENTTPDAGNNGATDISDDKALDTVLLVTETYQNVTMVDRDGNVLLSRDISDCEGSPIFAYGENVLFENYEYIDKLQSYVNTVYVLNVNTNETKVLFNGKSSVRIDLYDGVFYLQTSDYNTQKIIETAFDATDLSVVEDMTDFYANFDGYNVKDYAYGMRYSYQYSCAKRLMDTAGFVILSTPASSDEAAYVMYDGKNFTPIEVPENCVEIGCYTADGFVANIRKDKYSVQGGDLMLCDYNGNFTLIDSDIFSNLYYEDGIFYYSMYPEESFGAEEYFVKALDLKAKETKTLYSVKSKPGMSEWIFPGVTGFTKNGNTIFYLADGDKFTGWHMAYMDSDGTYKSKDLDVPLHSYQWLDYGTVDSRSFVSRCEICDATVYCFYDEIFVLDEKLGAGVAKINKDYATSVEENLKRVQESVEPRLNDPDECQYMHEYDYALETDEIRISEVKLLGDKYVQIAKSGYWYGGGAHGYPSIDYRLYNLETGERIKLQNIYPGSDDALKNLIAMRTSDKLASYTNEGDDWSPFYEDDPDMLYEQALEYINLENNNICFDEEGITYMYNPYELGPFAAGYIEVFVSYESLGITLE